MAAVLEAAHDSAQVVAPFGRADLLGLTDIELRELGKGMVCDARL